MLIKTLPDAVGIEISDIDLGGELDDATSRALMGYFDKHGLLVFRDQNLTQHQLVQAARFFGGLGSHPAVTSTQAELAEVSVITTRRPNGEFIPDIGNPVVGLIDWHSDQAYVPVPNRGKLLYAREVPPEGGMTGFIDGQQTYATLPDDLKSRIEGLHVVQSWRHAQDAFKKNQKYRPNAESMLSLDRFPDVAYPMVRIHPVTKEKVLNAPPLWVSRIVELPDEAGRKLLEEVFSHMLQPNFAYWHKYRVDDVVVWDNWRFLHAASGTPGDSPRTLWSVAIHGGVKMGSMLETT